MKAHEIAAGIDAKDVVFTNAQLTERIERLSLIVDALCDHLNVEICFKATPTRMDFVIRGLDNPCQENTPYDLTLTPSKVAQEAGMKPFE